MRKKAITILLAAVLVLSLAALTACGGDTNPDTSQSATGGQQSQQQQGETGQQQQQTTTTPTAEPTPDPEPVEVVLPPGVSEMITFGGMEWYMFTNDSWNSWANTGRDGYRLIISKYILEPRILATEFIFDEDAIWQHVWFESDLREYLNSEFLNIFTPEELDRIAEVELSSGHMPGITDRVSIPITHMQTTGRGAGNEQIPPTTRDGQHIPFWILQQSPTVQQFVPVTYGLPFTQDLTVEPNEIHGVRPAMWIRAD